MLRFATLFLGGLQIVTMEGMKAPLSLKELGNQRCSASQPFLPPCPAIKFLCCTFSRDMSSGLPSLATASYLPSQEHFSSKDQAPHSISMRCISGVQERGHTSFSALLPWPLEQPGQNLLPQSKGNITPPAHRKEKCLIPRILQIHVRYKLFHASYIFLYKV